MKDTRYYVQGIIGKLFHSIRFWKWVFYGFMQAVFIYLLSYNANSSAIEQSGFHQDLWSNGSIAYSGVVLIVNIKILLSTCTHSIISFILFFGSVFTYYLTLIAMSQLKNTEIFNNDTMIFSSNNFYLSTTLLVFLCILLDIGINRLMLLYGLVADPLKIRAQEYEPKVNKKILLETKSEQINNTCNLFF
jgi:hypothetical protein